MDKVFEEGVVSSDFFYNINEKILERHKLNDALQNIEKNMMYLLRDKKMLLKF